MLLRLVSHRRALVVATLVGSLCPLNALADASSDLSQFIIRQQIYSTFPRNLMLQQQRLNNAKLQQLRQNAAQQTAVANQVAQDNVRYERLGRQRIAAGRASTSFVRGPALAPAEYASMTESDPSARRKAADEYSTALRVFETVATQEHLKVNDAVDADALAFALAYQVYSGGQTVSAAQRSDWIRGARPSFLRDPLFQGTPDRMRQLNVEKAGINAIYAVLEYSAASKSNDAAKRDHAVEVAKRVLETLWTQPVDALELTSAGFADRGQRLISEGKATTRMTLSPTPITTDPDALESWHEFVEFAKTRGVAMDDAGQVQALAISINYQVYAGRPLNATQLAWAAREMSHDTLRDTVWQGWTDREKQQWLEKIVIDTVSNHLAFQDSVKSAPETAAGARQAAKKNLEYFFAPRVFDNYVLGPNGFQLRSGAKR